MATETRCIKCGRTATVTFTKIRMGVIQNDGTQIPPSQWQYVVDCPLCGTVEQRLDKKRARRSPDATYFNIGGNGAGRLRIFPRDSLTKIDLPTRQNTPTES